MVGRQMALLGALFLAMGTLGGCASESTDSDGDVGDVQSQLDQDQSGGAPATPPAVAAKPAAKVANPDAAADPTVQLHGDLADPDDIGSGQNPDDPDPQPWGGNDPKH